MISGCTDVLTNILNGYRGGDSRNLGRFFAYFRKKQHSGKGPFGPNSLRTPRPTYIQAVGDLALTDTFLEEILAF